MTGRRRVLLSAALLGMHSCWFYAWADMLERAASAPFHVAHGVVLLLVLAVAWRLLLERLRLHTVAQVVAYWALWPLAASLVAKGLLFAGDPWLQADWLLALPRAPLSLFFEPQVSDVILFIGSAAAWSFGQRAAFRSPDHGRLLADFQFGLVMLLVAFFVGYGFDVEVGRSLLLTVVFFAFGLSAIAAARSSGEDGGTEGLSRGQLSAAVLGSVGAVFAAALLVATIVRPEVIDATLDGIRYAGSLVGRGIAWIASLIPAPDYAAGDAPVPPATGDDSALIEWYRSLPVPAILRRVVFIVWIVVMLGILVFSLWRVCEQVLDWLRRRRNPVQGAVLEPTGRGLWADLVAFVNRLVGIIRRLASSLLRRLGASGDTPAATGIDVYLRLVRWTGKKVLPREPWQSPYEYLTSLLSLVPAAADDLRFVTTGYVDERYGRRPASERVVAEMAAAADRIRRAGRGRRASRGDTE